MESRIGVRKGSDAQPRWWRMGHEEQILTEEQDTAARQEARVNFARSAALCAVPPANLPAGTLTAFLHRAAPEDPVPEGLSGGKWHARFPFPAEAPRAEFPGEPVRTNQLEMRLERLKG